MLRICNSYSQTISTAISFFSPDECGGEGGDWQNIGWWVIAPGTCKVVYGNDLDDASRFWYFFAMAVDGRRWSGEFPTFVHMTEAFNVCDGIGTTALTRVGFRELDIGDNEDFTLTLVL